MHTSFKPKTKKNINKYYVFIHTIYKTDTPKCLYTLWYIST